MAYKMAAGVTSEQGKGPPQSCTPEAASPLEIVIPEGLPVPLGLGDVSANSQHKKQTLLGATPRSVRE